MSGRVSALFLCVVLTTACEEAAAPGDDGGSSSSSSSGDTGESGSPTLSGPPPPPSLDTGSDTDSADDDGDVSTGDGECPNVLADGGFENGFDSTAWYTDSTLFGTPLCNPACREGLENAAHEGRWWLWFGGIDIGESAHAVQVARVPEADAAWLSFHLRIPEAAGTGDDLFVVLIDGESRSWIYDTDAAAYEDYTLVTMDLTELADGKEHEIGFGANFPGTGVTSFYVDAVSLGPCPPEEMR